MSGAHLCIEKLIAHLVPAPRWLEETYPDKPSIFLPEAALPIDLTSREYRDALRRAKKFDWDCTDPLSCA